MRSLPNLVFVLSLLPRVLGGSVLLLNSTILGPDPQTVNRLNGESFQQDALTSFNGYQYAVFWVPDTINASVRHASVSRRAITPQEGDWETFVMQDYNQTSDDGHDIISLGISQGDGTLHMSFDQHDNNLNYRISEPGIATNPTGVAWSSDIFRPITSYLPGLESLEEDVYYINITYPRFVNIPTAAADGSGADLLLEMRTGESGLGNDWLYRYVPSKGWELIGMYLEGVNNNGYINGIDYDPWGRLAATWTYRDYVPTDGAAVAVEAGPNGPGNNHDLVYAYSTDHGFTWHNNWGQQIANTSAQQPILPESAGVTVFSIPKDSGILNQEAQIIDDVGRMHVLSRENTTGTELWYHYWRDTNTFWTRAAIPPNIPGSGNITGTPTYIGKRGKLVAPLASPDTLLAILPDNAANSSALTILRSTATEGYQDWTAVWYAASGCVAEPLFDRQRLRLGEDGADGVLSLYLVNGTEVVVVDLDISGVLV